MDKLNEPVRSFAARSLRAVFLVMATLVGLALSPLRAEDPKSITVALPLDYHPISGVNLVGEASGIMPDIWRLWSKKTGVQVHFMLDNFAGSVEDVRAGRADVHGSLFRNDARAEWLAFSRTLHEVTSSVHFRLADGTVTSLESLTGRAVGVLTGTHQQSYLTNSNFGFRVRAFRDAMEMLGALARGEVAAIVHEDLATETLVRRAGIRGEITRLPKEILRNAVHAGIPKSNPELRDLIDWGFGRIAYSEFQQIESRWVRDEAAHFFKPHGTVIPFNEAEKAWLKRAKTIRVGIMNNWPPMSTVDEQGKAEGMSFSFLQLINERLGGIVQPVSGPWSQIYNDVKEKRLDAIVDITDTRPRQPDFNFTRPYLRIPHVMVSRKDSPTLSVLQDLTGKTVAVERGFFTATYLRENLPSIKILETTDTAEALQALHEGRSDAYVGNQAVVRFLIESQPETFSDLDIQGFAPGRESTLGIGTRKDWPILRDIMEKTLVGIGTKDVERIIRPWLGDMERQGIDLSPKEQQWLARHQDETIRIGIDDWPPFSMIEDGKISGIAVEYARRVLTELGLQFEEIPLAWTDALNRITKTRTLDLIPDIARSESREKLLAFTNDFLSFPRVVFGRNDASLITGIRELAGKTVAVEKNFVTEEMLKRDHPDIQLHVVESTHDALHAVSVGKADAYVGNLAAASYHIERHGLSNIKVAAPTEYDNDKQAMAVRKDWPELASMIDKVLATMTEEEHAALRNKALTIKFEHSIDMEEILTIAVPVAGVLLIIIGVIAFSNRKLAREVGERIKVENTLKESENWFKSLLESAPDATIIVGADGVIKRINIQTEALFGYDRDEIVGAPVEVLLPEEVRARHPDLRNAFLHESGVRPMGMGRDLHARAKNGKIFPVEVSLSPMDTADGREVVATVRDITERREAETTLKNNLDELQAFNRLAVDRELRMIELKKEINDLNATIGKTDRYEIVE